MEGGRPRDERPEHRDELHEEGQHAQQDGVRHPEQGQADSDQHPDQQRK